MAVRTRHSAGGVRGAHAATAGVHMSGWVDGSRTSGAAAVVRRSRWHTKVAPEGLWVRARAAQKRQAADGAAGARSEGSGGLLSIASSPTATRRSWSRGEKACHGAGMERTAFGGWAGRRAPMDAVLKARARHAEAACRMGPDVGRDWPPRRDGRGLAGRERQACAGRGWTKELPHEEKRAAPRRGRRRDDVA